MLLQFYIARLQSQLSQRHYLLLNLLVFGLTRYKQARLERLAVIPLPVQFGVAQDSSKAFYSTLYLTAIPMA